MELNDKISDMERDMDHHNQQNGMNKENSDKREESLKKSIADANKTIDRLMKQISETQQEDQEKYNKTKSELEDQIKHLSKKITEYETIIKQKSESVINIILSYFN